MVFLGAVDYSRSRCVLRLVCLLTRIFSFPFEKKDFFLFLFFSRTSSAFWVSVGCGFFLIHLSRGRDLYVDKVSLRVHGARALAIIHGRHGRSFGYFIGAVPLPNRGLGGPRRV